MMKMVVPHGHHPKGMLIGKPTSYVGTEFILGKQITFGAR